MTFLHSVVLFLAALCAGALDSVAGGGSFISFPVLMATPVPPINANATNTAALWPGSLASVAAYRREPRPQRHIMVTLGVASLVGGLLGALILLRTPEAEFVHLLPFLLLIATLLFTFGGSVTARLRRRAAHFMVPSWVAMIGLGAIQLVIAAYGGFFGAGIGIVMLACLTLTGMENIHAMNALKTLLSVLINGVAVVAFVVARAIYWPEAILMVLGAILGGYGGAHTAQRIDPLLVRRFVIAIGFALTVYFFMHA
jgi:hypothetical protein